MRILHTSDWHLGKKIEGRDRLPEQKAALNEICLLADREKVEAVFVCGDIFDNFLPSAEAEDLFYGAITELAAGGRRLVVVIAGNHDDPVRLCAASALAGRQSIILSGGGEQDYLSLNSRNFTPIDSAEGFIEVQSAGGERLVLSLLPYPSDSRLKNIDANIPYGVRIQGYLERGQSRFASGKLNFNLTHLFAAGASAVGEEREIEVGGLKVCPLSVFSPLSSYVALGHIHAKQRLSGNVYYSGALLKYSISDTAQKGVMLFDAAPLQPVNPEFVSIGGGRDVVRITASGAKEAALLASETDAYVYLQLVRGAPLLHSEYKQLNSLKNVVGISIEGISDGRDITAVQRRTLTPRQLFTEYYKAQCGGEEPPADLLALLESLMHERA